MRGWAGACLSAGFLLALACCSRPAPEPAPAPNQPGTAMSENKGLDVFNSQGRKVLWIKDEPGPLLSTALAPPGPRPPLHPFLTGHAFYAPEEGRLREILDGSKSFREFVENLRKAGYTLSPAS